jgi:hypothetical protein
MSYPEVIKDTPIEEIKSKFHNYRQEAKGIEFSIKILLLFASYNRFVALCSNM